MTRFRTKRVYEDALRSDGYRVLVDRLWPRGISKERAALDEWAKDIAPSSELRQWYTHDAAKHTEFSERYTREIKSNVLAQSIIDAWRTQEVVTLLYAARDENNNEAAVLRNYLG